MSGKATTSQFPKIVAYWSVVLTLIMIILAIWNRDWLISNMNAENLRNIATVVAAIYAVFVGLPLALWRSDVVGKQTRTAELSLLNDRYQRSAEMLGANTTAIQLGGVYALELLAREHAEEYHIRIMNILCAFLRREKNDNTPPEILLAYEAVGIAIGRRSSEQLDEEKKRKGWRVNLENAYLGKMDLDSSNFSGANLSGATLSEANLTKADLSEATLSRANLTKANFSEANLSGANLTRANFSEANLSGANLSGATLTKANLSGANLSGATLSGANLTRANFSEANLSAADLTEAERLSPGQILAAIWDRNMAQPRLTLSGVNVNDMNRPENSGGTLL